MINIADLPSDVSGKTWRQKNSDRKHAIPLGALVEVISSDPGDEDVRGLRLFVVHHARDCDQTPLYTLSFKPLSVYQYWQESAERGGLLPAWNKACLSGMSDGGYSEECLQVIRLP